MIQLSGEKGAQMLMASGVLRAVLEAHFVGEKAVKEECKKKKKKKKNAVVNPFLTALKFSLF